MKCERKVLLKRNFWETQCAVLEDDEVVEYHFEELEKRCSIGRICAGIVEDVVPSLQCAFVRLPDGRRGYLFITETPLSRKYRIEDKLKPSQRIIVQILREEEDSKRPKLTMKIRIPGLFLIGLPFVKGVKFSHRIKDSSKLRKVVEMLKGMKDTGFIVRTSATMAEDVDAIYSEAVSMRKIWKEIANSSEFKVYYDEPSLHLRIIRDYLGRGIESITTDSDELFEEIKVYIEKCRLKNRPKITLYTEERDLFEKYRVKRALNKLYEKVVALPGGGFIVIDEVEGFTGIDVNTGGFNVRSDFDENAYLLNKLAVKEIVKQIRFRNIGGIIIVDFIDIKDRERRKEVIERLKEEFDKDRTVASFPEKMGRLGTVVFTREKEEVSLTKKMGVLCPHCGKGRIVAPQILLKQALEDVSLKMPLSSARVRVRINSIFSSYHKELHRIVKIFEEKTGVTVNLFFDEDTPIGKYYVEWQI